jgi:hypothetical protein
MLLGQSASGLNCNDLTISRPLQEKNFRLRDDDDATVLPNDDPKLSKQSIDPYKKV